MVMHLVFAGLPKVETRTSQNQTSGMQCEQAFYGYFNTTTRLLWESSHRSFPSMTTTDCWLQYLRSNLPPKDQRNAKLATSISALQG